MRVVSSLLQNPHIHIEPYVSLPLVDLGFRVDIVRSLYNQHSIINIYINVGCFIIFYLEFCCSLNYESILRYLSWLVYKDGPNNPWPVCPINLKANKTNVLTAILSCLLPCRLPHQLGFCFLVWFFSCKIAMGQIQKVMSIC